MKNKKWFIEELEKMAEERTFVGDWQSLPSYLPVRWIESSAAELANHLMHPFDPTNAIEECINIAYFAMVLARNLQQERRLDEKTTSSLLAYVRNVDGVQSPEKEN